MFTPHRTITAAAIAGALAIATPVPSASAASMPQRGPTVGTSTAITGSVNPGNHGNRYGNHGNGNSWNQGNHGNPYSYGNQGNNWNQGSNWNHGNSYGNHGTSHGYGNPGATGSVSGGAYLPGASTGINLGATAGLPGQIGVGASTGAGLGLS